MHLLHRKRHGRNDRNEVTKRPEIFCVPTNKVTRCALAWGHIRNDPNRNSAAHDPTMAQKWKIAGDRHESQDVSASSFESHTAEL